MFDGLITYVPIPCMCSGVITSDMTEDATFEVSIYHSPIGKFNGPIYAKAIYSPGADGNLKKGDSVQVLASFQFGGSENKFVDYNNNSTAYILGIFNEKTMSDLTIEAPNSDNDTSRRRWINDKSGAGMIADDSGKAITTSGSAIHTLLSPHGYGNNKNLKSDYAQNHRRTISHNPPYLSREQFGMIEGSDAEDEISKAGPEDHLINFRRFVTQSRSINKWVSLCEGAWQPWLGPNNNVIDYSNIGKEVLYSRIVNYDDNRTTLEMGEPGDSFVNFRVDKVVKSEIKMPSGSGAGPAILGNKFKFGINENGALDIRAVGAGTPGANTNKFHMSVDSDGVLTVHAAGGIKFSHGDEDEGISSITMDPKNGIDIVNKNGLRVNGKALVNEEYLKWMDKNKTNLCQSSAPGGPSPINPIALPEFVKGSVAIDDAGGFTTNNKGVSATGVITDQDNFSTS